MDEIREVRRLLGPANPVRSSRLGSAAESTGAKRTLEEILSSTDGIAWTGGLTQFGPPRVRAYRRLALIAVALAVTAAVLGTLTVLSGLGSQSPERRRSSDRPDMRNAATPVAGRLSAHGITLGLPKPWDGRITYDRTQLGPVLEGGNVSLPEIDTNLFTYAASRLESGDAIIVLEEFLGVCPCRGFEPVSLPITIRSSFFRSDPGVPEAHSFADFSFRVGSRHFYLWAEFGDREPSSILSSTNQVLRSLEFGPAPATPPGEPAVPVVSEAPRLEELSGWSVVTSGPFLSGDEDIPVTWATNEPVSAGDLACSSQAGTLCFPRNSLSSLSPSGVFIVVSLPLPGQSIGPPNFPDRELPPQLADAEVRLSWEGQVAPHVPEYLLLARVDGVDLDVRVYFGTPVPDADTKGSAQRELDTMTVPN